MATISERQSRLVGLLGGGHRLSAASVARRLGVSRRTVYREVAALASLGVPVRARPGPAGGLSLSGTWAAGYRVRFRAAEETAELDFPDADAAWRHFAVRAEAEVLEPAELRSRLHRQGLRLAGTYGPRERYFERRQIRAAIAWAEAGQIAVHRNFDSYHGTHSGRGLRMEAPFLHVIGLRPQLEEWGLRHGLRPEWIQPEKRRRVAHYDVFGAFAERLIERLRPA